nr:chorismate synthase [Spirochaetota bacterium]
DNLKELFRPGHADYTFFKKYGIRDHRGGGRSSGRETIGRVASGAFAKDILNKMGITVVAYSLQIGEIAAKKIDYEAIEKNSVRCCDLDAAVEMEKLIVKQKNSLDSIGGIVGLEIKGLKAGVGDPVFGKLSSRLASALFTIGSVKGLEFGLGFEFAKLSGSVSNDPMSDGGFKSNRAGGILGGISTGEDIIIRLAVKPTPSISLPQETIDKSGENVTVEIKGRHDPCVLPRIIPVVESMASLVILDALEIQDKLKG